MKTIICLTVFCIVAVIASNFVNDLKVLIARADQLVTSSNHLIADHRNNSRGHLLSALEFEVSEVDKFTKELKSLIQSNHNTTQINKLEEELVYHENRLAEEFKFVDQVYKNFNSSGKNTSELIDYGERLLTEAKSVLVKHQTNQNQNEINSIKAEISQVEKLVRNLKNNTFPKVSHLVEIILVRHERTLTNLIDRLNHK